MSKEAVGYEEFIPTDKWSLQDWYLHKMVALERIYTTLMSGLYAGGNDRRALIKFYSEVRSYNQTAGENIKKHLTKEQQERFIELLTERPDKIDVFKAEEIMGLLSTFHWKSGLSKLSESRPLGDFAYARQKLGIDKGGKE